MTWQMMEPNDENCVAMLKKNGLIVFKIIQSRYGYYADYWNNKIFETPHLDIVTAGNMATKEFGSDSIDNRIEVAKEFFVEDYKSQIAKTVRELETWTI